jgi:hypothetical protein
VSTAIWDDEALARVAYKPVLKPRLVNFTACPSVASRVDLVCREFGADSGREDMLGVLWSRVGTGTVEAAWHDLIVARPENI